MTPEQLRQWRRDMGWTQEEAARQLGRGTRSYEYLESGASTIKRETALACEALRRKENQLP